MSKVVTLNLPIFEASPTAGEIAALPAGVYEEALSRSHEQADVLKAPPSALPLATTTDRVRQYREIVLHQWECVVQDVRADAFTAVVRSLKNPSEPEAEAEIALEDISLEDRPLVEAGAVFYWMIGYSVSPGGSRQKASRIDFRRLPAWTKNDLARIKRQAREYLELFGPVESELRSASGQ